jgi:signal transduction histidine kinase
MVLYERVQCPTQLYEGKVQTEGNYRRSSYPESSYYEYEDHIYHSIECDEVYATLNTKCYTERKKNPTIDSGCIKNDLMFADEIYSICESGNVLSLSAWEDPSGRAHTLYYKKKECQDAMNIIGNPAPLTEVIIPLFGDEIEKSASQHPLAVLFIGQLGSSMTVNELLDKHGVTISELAGSMIDKTNKRRMEYLFAKQDHLQKIFEEELTHSKNIGKVVKEQLHAISKDFMLSHCLLFAPDLTKHMTLYDTYEAFDCITQREIPGITVSLKKIPVEVQNGSVKDHDISEAVTGIVSNDKTSVYLYRNEVNTGLFLWLEWKESTPTSRKYSDNFFKALLSMFFARMMARVAEIRKGNMATFVESTRHDIAQKIGTVNTHNETTHERLEAMARFCRNFTDIDFTKSKDKQNAYDKIRDFQKYFSDYHKAMDGLSNALHFLRNTLDTPEMNTILHLETFLPYDKFVFNLRNQFNRDSWSKGKKVFCFAPRNREDTELIADPAMLERLLSNLLHNANKYAFDGTNIYIDCIYDFKKYAYVFNITNFGHGIEQDDIFEWGVQANSNGGGYGLSIARQYAELHNGTLELTSGRISRDDPIWPRDVRRVVIAKILKEKHTLTEEFLSKLEDEGNKLRNLSTRNSVARDCGKDTLYEEIISDDAISHFKVANPKPGRLKKKDRPTYKITFTATIPIQGLSKEGEKA